MPVKSLHSWTDVPHEDPKVDHLYQTQVKEPQKEEILACEPPELPPPSLNLLLLFARSTQDMIRLHNLGISNAKDEIRKANEEEELLNLKKMEDLKKEIELAKSQNRWSTATSLFSWMTSFLQIISGIILLLAGNAVPGVLLIAGGALQATNHIMKDTGAWKKIAEALPGNDPEQKNAVITWMQIGIALVSFALMGAGGIIGGKALFGEGMQFANRFMGCIALFGMGIATLGYGLKSAEFYEMKAKLVKNEIDFTQVRFRRRDNMEHMEKGIEAISKLFSSLYETLDKYIQGNQMINEGFR